MNATCREAERRRRPERPAATEYAKHVKGCKACVEVAA